ncbi:MAG: hypothetical protein P1U85_12615 [Verrucomicrobiales bacterium]|nr:hypothetical protein [Verrucomicrobiales bacterium]
MRLLLLPLAALALLILPSCETKQEAYTGIADHNGIVTNNTRPVPKKEKKSLRQIGSDAVGIIPDW